MIKLTLSTGEQLVVDDEGHESVFYFLNHRADLTFMELTVYVPGFNIGSPPDSFKKVVATQHIVTAKRVYGVT